MKFQLGVGTRFWKPNTIFLKWYGGLARLAHMTCANMLTLLWQDVAKCHPYVQVGRKPWATRKRRGSQGGEGKRGDERERGEML